MPCAVAHYLNLGVSTDAHRYDASLTNVTGAVRGYHVRLDLDGRLGDQLQLTGVGNIRRNGEVLGGDAASAGLSLGLLHGAQQQFPVQRAAAEVDDARQLALPGGVQLTPEHSYLGVERHRLDVDVFDGQRRVVTAAADQLRHEQTPVGADGCRTRLYAPGLQRRNKLLVFFLIVIKSGVAAAAAATAEGPGPALRVVGLVDGQWRIATLL